MTVPEDRTTDSAEGAADQPSLARPVEEIRADLARAASPYYCGGGPVADRLATDAASLLSRLAAVEREAAEAKARAMDWERQADDHYAALIAARSQLADTQAEVERLDSFASYQSTAMQHELENRDAWKDRAVAAEARIEATQKRPWLVDLVNLTQQECYDKGRADVLAALVSPLPPEDTTNQPEGGQS